MKIWVCIPVFNRVNFTIKCLESLIGQSNRNFSVVICDHGSTDGTEDLIRRRYPEVIVIPAASSLWWTGAINVCVNYILENASAEDYLLTLNNDTEIPRDYLAEFAKLVIKYPRAVLTSVPHDIKSGKPLSSGFRQNWLTAKSIPVSFEKDHLPDDVDVVSVTHASGRGTLFPVAVFRELGLYDEVHLPHYGADYDFSHKARRAGYSVLSCRNCKVYSHVDVTGMATLRSQLSAKRVFDYFTSIRSPANIKARWWFGWNNCPRLLFPIYITVDLARVISGYFMHLIFAKGQAA
ncbi:glycosyltransferase family 2 protein [Methylomonas sp. SURF-1]|uniref:Glycosyltransferase family 2 protein n=1 Tax=Methylomonas aurea TaxID=2952224 RepID=A0ABT1UMX2_9GAMM|nr:glycosyltransferase family 2 protein [Methylomonas sp. SURF-1]MCQ8183168.1 glycosyltransferase family 2 protein [Methylomonas sp. SURF-1]